MTRDESNSFVTEQCHKFKLNKDFKIQGGTIGGENQLDYGNLCFQIRDGLNSDYSEKEVMHGVIKAAKPGSELRRYLERARNLTFEDFRIVLRMHYRVRESSKIMDDMNTYVIYISTV